MTLELSRLFNRSTLYPRMWYTVIFRWLGVSLFIVGVLFGLVIPEDPSGLWTAVAFIAFFPMVFGVILYGISWLAPIAVYQDRKALAGTESWRPSQWYYFMIFPTGLLGFILSIVYTRRRLRYHGYRAQVDGGPETQGEESATSA